MYDISLFWSAFLWNWTLFQISISFGKMSTQEFCSLFSWSMYLFPLLSYRSSLHIMYINTLSDILLANIFSNPIGWLSISLIISADIFSLIYFYLSIIGFVACVLVLYLGSICQDQCQKGISLFFQETYRFKSYVQGFIPF